MPIWGIVCSRARNGATPWTVPLGIETSVLVMTQHWAGYTPSKYNYWRSPFHIILGLHLQKLFFFFTLSILKLLTFLCRASFQYKKWKTNWCHCFNFIHISTSLYMFRAHRPILRRYHVAVHTTIGSVSVPSWSCALFVVACLSACSLGNSFCTVLVVCSDCCGQS
jgi:hypothetical protein